MTQISTPNQQGSIQKSSAQRRPQVPSNNRDLLKAMAPQVAAALPDQVGKDRFQRICLTMLTSNPQLMNCTQSSFMAAVLNTAQLGLEPNTPLGEAYLIPYRTKEGDMVVQYQVGYKGMIKLARQSGVISMIGAHEVRENDEFSYQLGLNPDLIHIPAQGERGQVIGYYAFYKTKDGDFDFVYWTKKQMDDFKKLKSKAKNGPWVTDYDAMAKKTVIKQVLKYAPLSTTAASAMVTDSQVLTSRVEEDLPIVDIVPDIPAIEAPDEDHTEA